jgi:curved DNA-binding protein
VLSPDQARLGEKIQYSDRKTGRELSVTIPPNTRAGQQLRLKGMGEPGRGGGEAGELYLTVNIKNSLIQKMKDFIAASRFSVG